jgi:hypothetical protein
MFHDRGVCLAVLFSEDIGVTLVHVGNFTSSFSSTNHSMQSSAQPLKVPATPSRVADNDKDKTPIPVAKQPATSTAGAIAPNDISSPHELTAFVSSTTLIFHSIFSYWQVETLLEQLDAKFDEMSTQILDRSLFISCFFHFAKALMCVR